MVTIVTVRAKHGPCQPRPLLKPERCRDGENMRRMIMTAICAVGVLTVCASGATQPRNVSPPSADDVLALRTADLFLTAWAMGDADAGVALMSRALIHSGSVDQEQHLAELRQFVAGLSNPRHQAFSIGAGIRQQADRYSFPVLLFELYSDADHGNSWTDTLEVVRDGGDWRVDRLPRKGNGTLR